MMQKRTVKIFAQGQKTTDDNNEGESSWKTKDYLQLSWILDRTMCLPRRKPTLPSPTRAFHRLPTLSLSLPIFRAQSFQSRFDNLSLSSTNSTSLPSSSLVHSELESKGDGGLSASLGPSVVVKSQSGCRESSFGRFSACRRGKENVRSESPGDSRDLKSERSRPSGISRGARRCRFGVEN